MTRPASAVVLAAGEGKRLRPLTLSSPKCFARVGARRILENTLDALSDSGCREVRIVVGHFAELIEETITDRFAGMSIRYVYNPVYQTTNSMYSLALGLDGLDSPTWVVEGDVFFEHSILGMGAEPEIAWFVDSSTRNLDGAYVDAGANGVANGLAIMRDLRLLRSSQCKSVGMLKLAAEGAGRLAEWLREGIQANRTNDYYDLVLGEHMDEGIISTVDVAGRKWYEIDTVEDLQYAERLFR